MYAMTSFEYSNDRIELTPISLESVLNAQSVVRRSTQHRQVQRGQTQASQYTTIDVKLHVAFIKYVISEGCKL